MDATDTPHMTRAKRKKIKREQRIKEKEQAQAERQRRQTIKKIRNYTITILSIAVIILFIYWKSLPPENAPILEIEKTAHKLGDVSQRSGIATVITRLTNTGSDDLLIKAIATSCMCTTANIIYDGKESPTFGMHTKPSLWSQTIEPGGEAQLKISYDPNVHPDLRGPVTRIVTIISNDPTAPQKEVKIYLNQIP